MSAEATSWAWGHATRMESPSQLLVLLALAEHASPTGDCFPNRKTIARMCGYSPGNPKAAAGTVTKHMKKLEGLDLLEKTARFESDKSGRQTSNIYRLKLEVKGQPPGGAVATPPVAEQVPPPGSGQRPLEPTASNPPSEPSVSADVQRVYDHFLTVFKPKSPPKLGPSLIRQIEKALKEYEADALCRAIDGLKQWRSQKPGKETLGAIFDTYPGGKALTEQIAFFIGQAKSATGVGKFPSADRAIVAEKQRLVQRGHRLSDNEEAVKQAKDAEDWLRKRGIETVQVGPGAVPTFRAVGSDSAGEGA